MKLLHTADWHLGKRLFDFFRLEEQRSVLEEICHIADAEEVDAVLIAGDLFDTFNPPNEAAELFFKTLHRLSKNGQRLVLGIAGNHDSAERIEAPDPLARECGIVLTGFPTSKITSFELPSGIKTLRTAEGFAEFGIPGYDYPLRVLLTPYASEARLKTAFSEEEEDNTASAYLKKHWAGLANRYCDQFGVNILMSHLFMADRDGVPLEEPEDERHILHLGGAEVVFSDAIPSQIQYTALGHLHRTHGLKGHNSSVFYSGSILEYSFSEAYQEKNVLILEIEPKERPIVRKVPLESGKPLFRQRFEEVHEAFNWLKENQECYVELTLMTDTFLDASLKRELYQTHAGIVSLIPELRSKATENKNQINHPDLSKSTEELFEQYFFHKEQKTPNPELQQLFREIVHGDVPS